MVFGGDVKDGRDWDLGYDELRSEIEGDRGDEKMWEDKVKHECGCGTWEICEKRREDVKVKREGNVRREDKMRR